MRKHIPLTAGSLVLTAAVCLGLGENAFLEHWQSFRTDMRTASWATRQRALTSLRDELFMKPITLNGRVTRVGSFRLEESELTEGEGRFRAVLSWEYEGLTVPPLGCEDKSEAETSRIAGERLRSWLPDGDTAQLVMVSDGDVTLTLVSQNVAAMDLVRMGQQVTVSARLLGLFGESFYGILDEIEPAE